MNKDYFLKRLEVNRPNIFESCSYDSLPETFSAHDKVPIDCYKHGVFHQKAYAHLQGRGCPECGKQLCADGRALTTEEFITNSRKRYGDRFDYAKTHYIRKDVAVTLTCCYHGDITLTPDNHRWSKHGCPQCDIDIPEAIRKQKVLERAKKIHGDKYDYSRTNFKNTTEKTEIVCSSHGSFWQSLYDHTVRGTDCPGCALENNKLSKDDFIKKSQEIHGNQYDYSKVIYETNASMVTITCPKHDDFIQRAASHLAGCKCKKCFVEESRRSAQEFIENAKKIHGDKYDYTKVVYLGNKKKVEIICPTHGSFWQKPNTHVSSGNGCRFCSESKGEIAVEIFLKKYGINYIREYRLVPNLYRYDFYLPGLDIFIEFHGIQHYVPVPIFGGREAYLNVVKRDRIKKLLVKASGGRLVTLTYLNLSSGSVEKELIRKLKMLCVKWYLIDDKLTVFRRTAEVYKTFGIPLTVLIRNLDSEVGKVVKDLKILF